MVPNNANSIVQSDVAKALSNGGNFASTPLLHVAGSMTRRHLPIVQALFSLLRRVWEAISYWNLPVSPFLQLCPLPRNQANQVRRQRLGAQPTSHLFFTRFLFPCSLQQSFYLYRASKCIYYSLKDRQSSDCAGASESYLRAYVMNRGRYLPK
jgi:hypothetical protein